MRRGSGKGEESPRFLPGPLYSPTNLDLAQPMVGLLNRFLKADAFQSLPSPHYLVMSLFFISGDEWRPLTPGKITGNIG